MSSPENTHPEHQNNPEHKKPFEAIDGVKWDNVTRTFGAEAAALEKRGAKVGLLVFDAADPEGRMYEYNADGEFFPASTGKLQVAEAMTALMLDPSQQWIYPASMVDLTGGGKLDKAGTMDRLRNKKYTVEAGEAIHHMLYDSSNTPVRLVAEQFSDGGAALSETYRDLGYKKTTLESHPNGRFSFETTTPRESLQSLQRLLELPDRMKRPNQYDETSMTGIELAEIGANALWTGKGRNHGVRQGIPEGGSIQSATKSGEYNADATGTPAVRNDVFTVTNGEQQLSGAFFVSGNVGLMDAADAALKRIGIELTHALGDVKGELGSAGLHGTLRPPEA